MPKTTGFTRMPWCLAALPGAPRSANAANLNRPSSELPPIVSLVTCGNVSRTRISAVSSLLFASSGTAGLGGRPSRRGVGNSRCPTGPFRPSLLDDGIRNHRTNRVHRSSLPALYITLEQGRCLINCVGTDGNR